MDTGKLTITLDNRDRRFVPAAAAVMTITERRRDWRWLWLRKRPVEHSFLTHIRAPLPTRAYVSPTD